MMNALTVLGYAIAIVMILLGLVLLFKPAKKDTDKANALHLNLADKPEQIELFSHVPLSKTPADLNTGLSEDDFNASQADASVPASTPHQAWQQLQAEQYEEIDHTETLAQNNAKVDALSDKIINFTPSTSKTATPPKEHLTTPSVPDVHVPNTPEAPVNLPPHVAAAAKQESFELELDDLELSNRSASSATSAQRISESPLLDHHLGDHLERDRHSAISQADKIIAIYLLPKQGVITGDVLLALMREYGLRYGEMSLFHRYKEADGTGPLMFSVLKYTPDGVVSSFDLESLVNDQIQGLAFFLALPNPVGVDGYDLMVHMSEHMARRLGAEVFDEDRCKMTRQAYEYTRQQVIQYV